MYDHFRFSPWEVIKHEKISLSPLSQEEKETLSRELENERRAMRRSTEKHYNSKPKARVCGDIFLPQPIKLNNKTYWILCGCGAITDKWDGDTRTMIHKDGCLVYSYLRNQSNG